MNRRGRTPTRRGLRVLGDLLLNILAIAGTVCIVLVILGFAFNVSIMMFRTGSMSPTIPAGSIAFVREIPATEMSEGDVVTVDRGENVLPVTHRVVNIEQADPQTGQVTFEMRGDANDVNDPEPYTASEVRLVMFSVPAAAKVVQWFGNPFVLGGLTIGASLLVVWAFWPRDDEDHDQDASDDEDGASSAGEGNSATAPKDVSAQRSHGTSRHAVGVPLATLALVSAISTAGPSTNLIQGEYLRMQTEGDPAVMGNMAPGESAAWTVGIWADAPNPGEIRLGIAGRGEFAEVEDAMMVEVSACSVRWIDDDCPTGAAELMSETSLDSLAAGADDTRRLTQMSADEQRCLRVTATLSESADQASVSGESGSVLIRAIGAGEEIDTGLPPGPGDDGPHDNRPGNDSEDDGDGALPRTGITGWLLLLFAGVALVAGGSALVSQHRAVKTS